jgi:hypothetical protein
MSELIVRSCRLLNDNQLAGQIPATIGKLTALVILYAIALTLSPELTFIARSLQRNQLIGPIPETLGQLLSLAQWYESLKMRISSISPIDSSQLQVPTGDANCLVGLDSTFFHSLTLTNRIARRIGIPNVYVRRWRAPRSQPAQKHHCLCRRLCRPRHRTTRR